MSNEEYLKLLAKLDSLDKSISSQIDKTQAMLDRLIKKQEQPTKKENEQCQQ